MKQMLPLRANARPVLAALNRRWLPALGAAACLAALAACGSMDAIKSASQSVSSYVSPDSYASTDVRRMATAGAPAYELRGHTLAALEAHATALCPKGHQVILQWEHVQAADNPGKVGDSLFAASNKLAGSGSDQASETVQCNG